MRVLLLTQKVPILVRLKPTDTNSDRRIMRSLLVKHPSQMYVLYHSVRQDDDEVLITIALKFQHSAPIFLQSV